MKYCSSRNTAVVNVNPHKLGLTVHHKIKTFTISVFCHDRLMEFCRTEMCGGGHVECVSAQMSTV
jgi:hypothetical protein